MDSRQQIPKPQLYNLFDGGFDSSADYFSDAEREEWAVPGHIDMDCIPDEAESYFSSPEEILIDGEALSQSQRDAVGQILVQEEGDNDFSEDMITELDEEDCFAEVPEDPDQINDFIIEQYETHLLNIDAKEKGRRNRGRGANKMRRKVFKKIQNGLSCTRRVGKGMTNEGVISMLRTEGKEISESSKRRRDIRAKSLYINALLSHTPDEPKKSIKPDEPISISDRMDEDMEIDRLFFEYLEGMHEYFREVIEERCDRAMAIDVEKQQVVNAECRRVKQAVLKRAIEAAILSKKRRKTYDVEELEMDCVRDECRRKKEAALRRAMRTKDRKGVKKSDEHKQHAEAA